MGGKLKPLIDESMKAMFLREQYPWRGRHILRHNGLAAQRTTSSFEIILPTDASYGVSCKLNNLIENLHELFWRENFLWRISTKLVFEWTSCSMHKQIGSGMWFWLKQSVVSLNYIMESVNNFVHLFSTNLRIIEQIDQNGFVENCLHILFWRKNLLWRISTTLVFELTSSSIHTQRVEKCGFDSNNQLYLSTTWWKEMHNFVHFVFNKLEQNWTNRLKRVCWGLFRDSTRENCIVYRPRSMRLKLNKTCSLENPHFSQQNFLWVIYHAKAGYKIRSNWARSTEQAIMF